MKHPYACRTAEHGISRRHVLKTMLGSAAGAGLAPWAEPLLAGEAKKQRKQMLFLWLDGACSQFETWDPKPGTIFGGPFRSIQTKVPSIHISELMPEMAQRMDRFSTIRSMHTRFEDHSRGVDPIQRGDPKNRGVTYPFLGSALAKWIGAGDSGLPPYIHIKPGSGGFMYQDGGFLGPEYGSLALGDGLPPANLAAPPSVTPAINDERNLLRQKIDQRFTDRRMPDAGNAYKYTYRVAEQMMKRADLFDPTRLKAKDIERYGNTEIGRHMAQASRLLEAGVTFVKVTMFHWDTHGDNFNCHQAGIPQVDRALGAMIDDLVERGMYDHTMIVMMSEFGRTPRINGRVGRDHWPECWSVGLGGGGIKPGVVVGKTNELGTFNSGQEYDVGHLFHTIFKAMGVDPTVKEYDNRGQPLPIAHEDCSPIAELLA
ncbi:MAG: DUF1501 domain-containing protein [Planctomycetes bacterium]|nr:DUF1501 domain-containing protein [Planctomycetota bacterium]